MITTKEQMSFWRMMGIAVILISALLILAGCSTGVSISLRDASGINVGSISYQESQWPIASYLTGPTFNFWVKEDHSGKVWAGFYADMTNHTSACGIYESGESKTIRGVVGYNVGTNVITTIEEKMQ